MQRSFRLSHLISELLRFFYFSQILHYFLLFPLPLQTPIRHTEINRRTFLLLSTASLICYFHSSVEVLNPVIIVTLE